MSRHTWILAAITCALAAGCVTPPTLDEFARADYGAAPDLHEDAVKRHLGKRLFDPYSAVYTFDAGPTRGWTVVQGQRVFGYYVCGTVNAKNRFGAYVGANPFWAFVRNGSVVAAGDWLMSGGGAECPSRRWISAKN